MQVLAFRLWMEPSTLFNAPDVGGFHTAPVLGEAGAVAAGYQMRWLELIRTYASSAALALLFGLLAVVAFSLILFDRSDRVYLWMGTLFLLIAVTSASGRLHQYSADRRSCGSGDLRRMGDGVVGMVRAEAPCLAAPAHGRADAAVDGLKQSEL
jgi:hypothetical protein